MKKLLAMLALTVFAFGFTPPASADSLGVGVIVLPDAENTNVDFRSVIWFGVEPGDTKKREILVRSAGDITQAISFAVFDLGFDNGEEFVDTAEPGEISDWVKVTPSNLLLEPGEESRISIEVSVPPDAEEKAFQSSLRILAADGRDVELDNEGGFKAVIAGAAAVDVDLWLGVGDALSLVPSFEITELFGVIDGQDKYLRIVFTNTGVVPLELTGAIEFSDRTFIGRTFGPYEFQYVGLEGGLQGFVDVPVSAEIQEGPWDIYVRARQGNIRESRVFNLDLTFRDIAGFDLVALLPILLSLILAVAAVFGLRLVRAGRSDRKKENSAVQTPRVEAARQKDEVSHVREPIQTPVSETVLTVERSWRSNTHGREVEGKTATRKKLSPTKQSELKKESRRTTSKSPAIQQESDVVLDQWAESLRQSLREVRADSTDLVEKYKDVPTRKPRKPKAKD